MSNEKTISIGPPGGGGASTFGFLAAEGPVHRGEGGRRNEGRGMEEKKEEDEGKEGDRVGGKEDGEYINYRGR